MQLFHNTRSPYVRKVMVTLIETGQQDEVELIEASGTPLDRDRPPFAHNPLGKVPTLLRGDGPALFDSRVICRFLDARARAGLYPETRLWEVLTLEALADGILDAAVTMTYEERCRPEGARSADWVESQWAKVAGALDALDARWISHLAGRLDIGQIGVGCALGYLDFRHGARGWRTGRSALAEWQRAFAARPSMTATAPE